MNDQLKKHTYRATMPDGSTVTRTTNRVYTHVIVRHLDSGITKVDAWAGRPDLAEKKVKEWPARKAYPVDNPR